MTTIDLLAALEEQFPISRQINIDGFPHPLWLWRIEIDSLTELLALPRETQSEQIRFGAAVCAKGIGNEKGERIFDCDRGRLWLNTHPIATAELAKAVFDFNELEEPNEDRKKKSETADSSNVSLNSASESELSTLDI